MAGGPDSAVSAENSATSPSWADPGRAGRLPIGRWEKRALIGGGGGTADMLSRGRDGEAGGPSEALRSHGATEPAGRRRGQGGTVGGGRSREGQVCPGPALSHFRIVWKKLY